MDTTSRGNDGWISFSIGLLDKNGEILTGAFSYNEHTITNFEKNGKIRSWSVYQRIKITPNTIRQVIEYGLNNGWNPQENKGQIRLGNMDDKIELNLKEEPARTTLFPITPTYKKSTARSLRFAIAHGFWWRLVAAVCFCFFGQRPTPILRMRLQIATSEPLCLLKI